MATKKTLHQREDVNDADIPEIIERAEKIRNRQEPKSSVNDVKEIGRELDIDDRWVDLAIAELNEERRKANEPLMDRKSIPFSNRELWIGAFVLVIVWMIWSNPTQVTNQTVIQNTPVEERVIKEKVTEHIIEKTIVKEVIVEKEMPPKMIILDKKDVVVQKSEDTGVEEPEVVEEKPTVDTIIDDSIELREFSKDLVTKKIQGDWELQSYFLWNSKTESYIEVPITKGPMELRASWNFQDGRYRRVMDEKLAFSGQFVNKEAVESLLRPPIRNGTFFLIEASDVYSTLGMSRDHDYFHAELKENELIIWYLGTNIQKSQPPSQAELYRRK